MNKKRFAWLAGLAMLTCAPRIAEARIITFSTTSVAGLDCTLTIRGQLNTETGHGWISWDGPCGHGGRVFQAVPGEPVEPVSGIEEAKTKYDLASAGNDDGDDGQALAAFNAVAEDPEW